MGQNTYTYTLYGEEELRKDLVISPAYVPCQFPRVHSLSSICASRVQIPIAHHLRSGCCFLDVFLAPLPGFPTHSSTGLPGSSDAPASASRVAGTTSGCHHTQIIFVFFLVETGFHHVGQDGLDLLTSILLCCPGWSVVAQSKLTATPPFGFKQFSHLSLPSSWDYRHVPPCLANKQVFTMMARLVSNSWPQVIGPPRPPEVLGLQTRATVPDYFLTTGFHHVGQAGLELLTSSNLPALASQSAEIT
ncbi:hypothetical protein AAY473_032060, partial [Plecturocebus cupreus]